MKVLNRIKAFSLVAAIFASSIGLPHNMSAKVYAEEINVLEGSIYFSADTNGTEPIEHIGGFDSVWVNGTVYGDAATNEKIDLYVALYEGNIMSDIVKKATISAKGPETDFSYEISDLPQSESLSAKAFLWTDNMKPLVECAEVKSGIKPHIEGIYEAYKELEIVFDGDVVSQNEISQITWQSADSKIGDYTSIEGADAVTYMTTANDAGKWIKAEVIVGENTYETEPKQINSVKTVTAYNETTSQIGTNEKTPGKYKFTVDGVEFILLDVTEDDDAKFFVMVNNKIGVTRYSRFAMYTNDNISSKTDVFYSASGNAANSAIASTPVDIAAFLNTKDSVNVIVGDGEAQSYDGAWKYGTTGQINGTYSFGKSPVYGYSKQTTGWTQIPDAIKNYINNDLYWVSEPNSVAFNGQIFAVQGGLMPLSHSEVEKYSNRIGLWEYRSTANIPTKLATCWWLRSPAGANSSYSVEWDILGKTGGRAVHLNGNAGAGVRPAFYLDRNVFLDNKIDLRTAGSTVREEILSAYTRHELLSNGYTKADLSSAAVEDFTFETLALKGIYETFQTINVDCTLTEGIAESITSYEWLRAGSEDGEYTAINGATAAEYAITSADAAKWIKCRVTADNGVSSETEPRQIGTLWNVRQNYITDPGDLGFTPLELTPADNVFGVDGRRYILLDETESDESHYLVLAQNCVAQMAFDTGATQVFDSTRETNAAYWLNNEGLNGKYIPTAIVEHINHDHTWKLDITMWGAAAESSVTAGVVIPAMNEIRKYSDKIGLNDDNGLSWWTRTPVGWRYTESGSVNDGSGIVTCTPGATLGTFNWVKAKTPDEIGVRPIFYLDKDFFASVKLDYAGSSVQKFIEEKHGWQKLVDSGIYTDAEKEALLAVAKENITITAPTECSADEFTIKVDFDVETVNGAEYKIAYTVGDASYEQTVMAKAGAFTNTVKLPLGAVKNGIYDYFVTVTRDSETAAELTRTVYISEPYTAQFLDKYTLKGYCGIVNSDATAQELYSDGAGMVRQSVRWEQVELSKGSYDWTVADRIIPNMLENDIEPMVILATGNTLYTNDIANTKEGIDAFAAYAAAVAQRYPEVKYYEVLNEPNGKSPLDVSLLCRIVERELHKINPDIVVMGGSMADSRQEYLSTLYRYDTYNYFDAVSSHPYVYYYGLDADDDSSVAARITRVNAISENYGGWKENYINEIGWSTSGSTAAYISDEHDQAVNLVKQFAIADSRDADMNLIYRHIDNGTSATNAEHGFGVKDFYGKSKEAHLATRAYLSKMRGAQYFGEMPLMNSGEYGYLYIKDGEPLVMMWKKDGSSAHAFTEESLNVFDMFGNLIQCNTASVNLTDDPVYVSGFSDRWFNMAIKTEFEEKLSYYLENIGQTDKAYLFDVSAANADIVAESSVILTESQISGFIDTHYAIADSIIKLYTNGTVDRTACSALLNVLNELGEIWINYYSLTDGAGGYALQSTAAITVAETSLAKLETSVSGGRLPISEKMLRMARRYSQNSAEVLSGNEENAYKAGIVKAWDRQALEIAEIVQKWMSCETVTTGNIIIQVPTGDATLEYNQSGTVKVGVYNYGTQDIDGTLKLVDAFGNTVGTAAVNLKAGKTKSYAITGTVSDGGAVDSMVTAVLTQSGKELCRADVMVIKQTERLADTLSPAPVFKAETDAADLFRVDGKDYILLDTFDSKTSKFMVITKDEFGGPKPLHSAADGTWSARFETEDERDIGYWLNTTLPGSGKLPSVIVNNIDFNHYHLTEGSSYIVDVPYDYQTKAGIAVLSVTEAIKYADKLGMLDGNLDSVKASGYNWSRYQYFTWMLRTGRNKHDVVNMMRVIKAAYNSSNDTWSFTVNYEPVNITTDALRAKCRVRPMFYLADDFFLEAKIPVADMGDNVKAAVKASYTRDELTAAGYSAADMTALGF